jgi:hypothetical protein
MLYAGLVLDSKELMDGRLRAFHKALKKSETIPSIESQAILGPKNYACNEFGIDWALIH